MKTVNHIDLGKIKIILEWGGNGNKIVLAKSGFYFYYCLWGPSDKPISTFTPIELVTPTGKPRKLGPSLKLFNQMVKSARVVNIS